MARHAASALLTYATLSTAALWPGPLATELRSQSNPSAPVDAQITFSTFLGGGFTTYGTAIAVDRSGFIYLTGRSRSPSFPRVNAPQRFYGGGENDAFIVKMTGDGQRVVYSTLFGGRKVDFGNDIAVDDAGNAYLCGSTYSDSFPTSRNAAQRRFGGGDMDAFVVRLDPDGKVVYSTLLGGKGTDRCNGIAVDASGNAYIAGSTSSPGFATPFPPPGRTDWDVLLAKLEPSGKVAYAIRFGGTVPGPPPSFGGGGAESASDLKIDAAGVVHVVGSTLSTDFPMRNAAQPTYGGGDSDGFIARLDGRNGKLLESTFLGGAGRDGIAALALDASGNVLIIGTSYALEYADSGPVFQGKGTGAFPVRNALQPAFKAALFSPFVARLSGTLSTVDYATYLSGSGLDRGADIAVDRRGNAYVTGTTQSEDFPLVNPVQSSKGAGQGDAFIARIAASGAAIEFSTYLGGNEADGGAGIALDAAGDIYVIGHTGPSGRRGGPGRGAFPTFKPLQPDPPGTRLAFVTRIGRRHQ